MIYIVIVNYSLRFNIKVMFGHKLRYKIKVVFALVENMVIKNRSRIPIAVLLTTLNSSQ